MNNSKQLIAQQNTFMASLGHDLKNPTIAQIRGLELLLKGHFGELSCEQKDMIEIILDSCRYMNGMLSSLLESYKNSDSSVKLNFNTTNFTELVEECVSEMLYVAKDKDVKIIVQNDLKNELIETDRIQLKRVLINLISNGIKYAYKGTELLLNIYSNKNKTGFSFSNKSPYIPREKREKLFAKYVTFSGESQTFGTGLGLYTSKKIITALEGTMYIHSKPDNTNCFGFEIPVNISQKNKTILF